MRYLITFYFALLLFSAGSTHAAIIHVPADSPSIQAGINDAAQGDTVLVAPGTYYEHINFNRKAILVKSDSGAAATTIAKYSNGTPIVLFDHGEDTTSVLDGFTVCNANYESGIVCWGSSPRIKNNVITNNTTGGYGGGIHCYIASPVIEYNEISYNSAQGGGGIYVHYNSSPVIANNRVAHNSVLYNGGGIYCLADCSPTITGNSVISNTCSDGGGILCDVGCSGTISFNLIVGNAATSRGGGVFCYSNSSPLLLNNTIALNEGYAAEAGGIVCQTNCSPPILNCIVSGTLAGYGIHCSDNSLPSISSSDLWGNAYGDYFGCDPGEGCFSSDPFFCDPEHGNYYLHSLSPCVGTGDGGADVGAFGVGCGNVVVTAGPDQSGQANTQVVVTFYVHNIWDSTLTFDLNAFDTLGWDIFPEHSEMTLGADEVDFIDLTVSIPDVMTGKGDRIYLTAATLPDSFALDAAFLSVTVSPRTIYVPYQRPTIQGGIDASGHGDTILVAPGTYYEQIFFNGKAIILRSEKGRDSTVISKVAGGISMVSFVSGEDSNSVVDGFTITGGSLESGQGAGINCLNSSPKILNNRIVNNSCPYGAGIACDDSSSPVIANNLIESNTATLLGGGVYCFDFSSPMMSQNVIRGNWAGQNGGGVYCQGLCSPAIAENLITGNTADISGGGLYFYGVCSPTITGNLISDNIAQTNAGGGIAVLIMSSAEIIDNTLDRNRAGTGGGIYRDATSSATIANTIVTNTVGGRGIWAEGAFPVTLVYCDVWNNLDENYYGCVPGEGCLSEDPLFCDPENDNYYLWFTSPCLGTGQDGSDIGAFGQGCSAAGDANADGEINIGDIVYLVNYLYKGGPAPTPVPAGDANGDGVVDVGDMVYLVNYLYRGGPPPCEP